MRKLLSGLIGFIVILSACWSSAATEVTVFGPKRYVRTTGGTTKFTESLSAVTGLAILHLKNGESTGDKRVDNLVSSASVFLNGSQIWGPNNFNQKVDSLESSIVLATTNSLQVELNGSPGSFLTIWVTQLIDPPVVSLAASVESVRAGETTKLQWTSNGAQSCNLSPDVGSVALNGTLEVTPHTTTTYSLTATGLGGTTTKSITIEYVNTPPVAQNISIDTDEDTPIPITLAATDRDGDIISYEIVTPPAKGTLAGAAPALIYTPAVNNHGNISFTYTARDTVSVSNIAKAAVTINPVNDPPVAVDDAVTTREDEPVVMGSLLDNDVDVDGDSLQITNFTQAAHGTINQQGANLVYTPNPNFDGNDAFSYTISDPSGDKATANVAVIVEPVDDHPISIMIEEPSAQANVNKNVSVSGTLNASSQYVNVFVNGERAAVQGNNFFINDLKLPIGNTEINVSASDKEGNQAIVKQSVFVQDKEDDIRLDIGDQIGMAPHNTSLKATLNFSGMTADSATITYKGPGIVESTKKSDTEFNLLFSTPGIYSLTYSTLDGSGSKHTATTKISIMPTFTQDDYIDMQNNMKSIEDIYITNRSGMNIDDVRQIVLNTAKDNPNFSSAALTSDSISLIYKNMFPIIIDLPDPNKAPH